MSALIDTMFSVRQVPWHREGIVLGDYPGSWAEARKQAGLEWDPIAEPVYRLDGVDTETFTPIYVAEQGWKRVVRSDTNATLSIRPASYEIIDHAAMGEVTEAILAEANVRYETAGSLDGGKAVWCLVKLDEPIQLPGDNSVTLPFLALTNRHDGGGGLTARATTIRIVCMNTFRAAEMEGERTGTTFSFRHTANWRDRIAEAKDAVTGARLEMRRYVELSKDLLDIRVTPAQREMFVTTFIGSPPEGTISKVVMANIEQARNAVRTILASETTEPVAHTAYGLVQAAGEYLDHIRRSRSWETKLNRTLLQPEPLKGRALRIVRELVKADA